MSALLFIQHKRHVRERRDLVFAVRLAVNADQKAMEKYLNDVERELK